MSIQKNLITLCFATVFTLGLAACGSDATVNGNGNGNGNGDEPDARTVAELFATAQESRDASAAAAKAAEDAVEAATEAMAKLTTLKVKGESMTATANAQAVLDMQAATVKAATDAETALQEAKDALEDATEHAADNASLMAALDAAIKAAEADVKTATDARDGGDLKAAVALVRGGDEDMPMSPGDHGTGVAMDVGMALMPTSSSDGGRNDVSAPHGALADAAAVKMSDQLGHTWAQIVGADNIMNSPLGTETDAERASVMVASIAGMTASDVHAEDLTATGGVMEGDTYADGHETLLANYDGIPGTVYCLGTDCKVDSNGKLAGSWYFTPMSTTDYYLKVDPAAVYTEELEYAQFGHWLSVDATMAAVVNTYALTGGNMTGLNVTDVNEAPEATTLLDKSATYEGTAAGMSLHKEVDGDGAVVPGTLQSGAFTADVTLTAKFQTTPTLSGYINGFEGNAVDPDWRVMLLEDEFTTATLTEGTTTASAQNGEWSATGYGVADERPTGIFGGFNAHFTDGHAAGAYATRK